VVKNEQLRLHVSIYWNEVDSNLGDSFCRTSAHQPYNLSIVPLSKGIINTPNLTFPTNRFFPYCVAEFLIL